MDLLVVCPICGCYLLDDEEHIREHHARFHSWYLLSSNIATKVARLLGFAKGEK